MIKDKRVYAIIGAAGSGKRMAAPLPKQFMKLPSGKTVLETTVEKFDNSPLVDHIIVVTAEEYLDLCCQFFSEKKKIDVIIGGEERQDSIYRGIQNIPEGMDDEIVLIHDGARPYVSEGLIERVIGETPESLAVVCAVPTKDTIRHEWEGTLDRSKLYNVQTPQGFKVGLIREGFTKAFDDDFYGTDDASLVERLGHAITIVAGEESNIKITTREDLKTEMRVGIGYDVHRLVEGRPLILGGVEIPHDKGLLGHSDADVLIHALMDAMLGAAALKDIGYHFPDTDDRYAGISSIELLKCAAQIVGERGYTLGNADITVMCQRPKLAGFIDEMRLNIAKALATDQEKINIKATTTEKLGFAGREEGIAAEAVCLLNR